MAEDFAISRLELARLVVQAPNANDANHDAIVNQRVSDLKRIISKYPQLLREGRKILSRVDDGMLPLHHAVENQAPLAVIDLLAEAFKPAIFQQYTPPSMKGFPRTVLNRALNLDSSEIYGCLLRHSMSFLRLSLVGGWKEIEFFFQIYGSQNTMATRALLRNFPGFARRKGSNGNFPLHTAVWRRAPEEVVAMLVGANPQALTTRSGDGTTPLHILVGGPINSLECVRILTLCVGAARIRNWDNQLPIHTYVRRNVINEDDLEVLVNAYPESVMQVDNCERTPLLCHLSCNDSADERNLQGIQYLVQSNPESIKLVDKYGKNALHYACKNRGTLSSTVIHFLYETYPENLMTLDSSGQSPLHYLCENADNDDLPLFEIMHEMTPQSFSLLSKNGSSPLHIACHGSSSPSIGLVSFLAVACPLALRVIANGATPFHMACIREKVQLDVIRFLAEECPDLLEGSAENLPFHETPLNVLCQNEHIANADLRDCLRALVISKGAVERLDRDRNSTLHALCRRRASPECLEIILEQSPDLVFARNANAQTALHVAVESCASGQESNCIVELLLKNRNVELLLKTYPLGIQDRDMDLKTPLVVACEKDVSLGVIYQLFRVDPISSLDMLRNAAVFVPTMSIGK